MCHEHATHAPAELLEIGKTAAGPNLILHHPPKAFNGIEMVAASGWQALQPKVRLPMGQRRGECVRPVDATVIDDHYDLSEHSGYALNFPGSAEASEDSRCFITKNSKDFVNPDIENELGTYTCRLLTKCGDGLGYIRSRL